MGRQPTVRKDHRTKSWEIYSRSRLDHGLPVTSDDSSHLPEPHLLLQQPCPIWGGGGAGRAVSLLRPSGGSLLP